MRSAVHMHFAGILRKTSMIPIWLPRCLGMMFLCWKRTITMVWIWLLRGTQWKIVRFWGGKDRKQLENGHTFIHARSHKRGKKGPGHTRIANRVEISSEHKENPGNVEISTFPRQSYSSEWQGSKHLPLQNIDKKEVTARRLHLYPLLYPCAIACQYIPNHRLSIWHLYDLLLAFDKYDDVGF